MRGIETIEEPSVVSEAVNPFGWRLFNSPELFAIKKEQLCFLPRGTVGARSRQAMPASRSEQIRPAVSVPQGLYRSGACKSTHHSPQQLPGRQSGDAAARGDVRFC